VQQLKLASSQSEGADCLLSGLLLFPAAASTEAGRQTMVANCIDLFIKRDIWAGAFPRRAFRWDRHRLGVSFAIGTANVTLLMQNSGSSSTHWARKTRKHYLLTMFGPAGEQNFSNIELAAVGKQIDYYNVQGYDFQWNVGEHYQPRFSSAGR